MCNELHVTTASNNVAFEFMVHSEIISGEANFYIAILVKLDFKF